VTHLSPSREQRIRQFFTLKTGDRKPSQFLRHLRGLIPDVPDDFLRSIWSSWLPSNVRTILAGQPKGDLDAASRCADRIIEVTPQPTHASVAPLPDSSALHQRIEDLSRQVAALSTELAHLRPSSKDLCPNNRKQHSGNRSPSREDAKSICWYHHCYGARAQKCTQSCSYRQQEKLPQPTSTAAHVCSTTTDRLFITDRISKRQFLIHTGSDLYLYPRRLIPRRKEWFNYDLYAPNGTTIPTYGWLPL
jgi:hypothetical protein